MRKNEIKRKIQDGFLELSPEIFEAVMDTAKKENLMPLKTEYEEKGTDAEIRNLENVCKGLGSQNRFWINFPKYAMSVCTCLLVFFLWVSGIFGGKQEDVFLVLDINPSVQIVMNDSYQVKRLNGLNEDGKEFIKKLEWSKKESVFDLLDLLLQGAVEESFLRDDSGILVTICLSEQKLYEDLESKLGEKIDQKLKEIGVCGVLTDRKSVV